MHAFAFEHIFPHLGRDRDPHRELRPRRPAEGGVGVPPLERGAREHRLVVFSGAGDEAGSGGLAHALLRTSRGGDHDPLAIHDRPDGAPPFG